MKVLVFTHNRNLCLSLIEKASRKEYFSLKVCCHGSMSCITIKTHYLVYTRESLSDIDSQIWYLYEFSVVTKTWCTKTMTDQDQNLRVRTGKQPSFEPTCKLSSINVTVTKMMWKTVPSAGADERKLQLPNVGGTIRSPWSRAQLGTSRNGFNRNASVSEV
jgi:hypothetical protein